MIRFSNILTLAHSTFKALLRDRILYNVIFIAFFLLLVGYWASLLVFGHQDRVMLHFGMMVNSLAVFGIAITAGSRIILQETESRIIYLILSKPVSRTEYWLGKLVGLGAFTAVNLILLMLVLAAGVSVAGGQFSPVMLQAATLIWVESCLIAALALSISLWLTPALTSMISITFLFISHNHEQIEYLKTQSSSDGLNAVHAFANFFPRADQFLLDTRVYYDMPLAVGEWATRFGYGFIWIFIFIIIGNAFFMRKNL